ncbi:MAG: response regulator [Planctomycetota bacterium]|nr:response regulator [Planctomycetota bacterium]
MPPSPEGRPPDDIQRQLRPRYLDRVVSTLRGCLEELDKTRCSDLDRGRARDLAHQLRGSLGTYGYQELTGHARAIEELTQSCVTCESLRCQMKELLERLREERIRLESEHATLGASGPRPLEQGGVLCIEDDSSISMLISLSLRPLGTNVTVISNGAEGWAHLERSGTQYDLLLLDVSLPELDGFSILERLRADARLRALPVIVLSARLEEQDLLSGADATTLFLRKPFSTDHLLETCRRLIGARRSA